MKTLLTLLLILTSQILTSQNREGFSFSDIGEIQTFDPSDPWWSIGYIDSSYWGTVLTYKEYKELPHQVFPIEKPFEYNFDPYIPELNKWDFSIPKAKKQKLVPWKVTGIAVFATVTEAIGDAKFDDGCKIQGKALQAISLGSHFLYIPVMKNSNANWLLVPLVEMCWRFILFDMVYNLTRGLPVGYIGNTSYFDKGLQAFGPPAGMRMFANGIAATFVITLTFDKF